MGVVDEKDYIMRMIKEMITRKKKYFLGLSSYLKNPDIRT